MFSFKLSYTHWINCERRQHYSYPFPICPLPISTPGGGFYTTVFASGALNGVCVSGVRPVGTAAGVWLPGEAERGGPTRRGSRAEGGPRGEMLWEEACPGAPQGVKGVGEVGQRCGEGQGGGRRHGGGMRG